MSSKPYFDAVAQQWDQMRQSFFSEAVREKAIAVAGVQPGKLAADIGAGTGFITQGLLQNGLQVIAVDQSEAMLMEMKRKFAGAKGLDCRLGQAGSLPIPDATVDYVFANMYLHHVESPPQAIQEMVRTLKPGGKLVITDLDEHNYEFLKAEHHDRWMGFKREDVKRWFEAAGLQQIDVDCVGQNCCAQSSCGTESASISIFVASGEKRRARKRER
ncbi:MAG: methyltransferase domain-containing protein [Deinococcus sp.]|nr:methyltransferase domain-containing protein [Deinococcus sp.]